MGHFDFCPDSVLEDIISRLRCTSHLVSLSLTCRRMQCIAAPILRLKQRFRSLYAFFGHDGGTWLSIRTLPYSEFCDILNRADLSACIHDATIEIDSCDGIEQAHSVPNCHFLGQSEGVGLLDSAVEDLGVREWEDSRPLIRKLEDLGVGEWNGSGRLLSNLRFGVAEARAALFLLMLSNLQKLDLCYKHEDEWIGWVIKKVVSSEKPRLPRVSYGFLSLREVRLRVSHTDDEVRINLDTLAPFFLLPSLEKIFGFSVCHVQEKFEWENEFGVSSVREIHFSNSFISAAALGEFLRIPKTLHKFSFKYACGILVDEFDSDDVMRVDHVRLPEVDSDNVDSDRIKKVHYDEIHRVVTRTLSALPLSNIEIGDQES